MAPAQEAWRDIIAFDLPEQADVSCRDAFALALATRRALMALSRDIEGEVGRLFSGHEADGDPASSGRHEHMFIAADDNDGDGRVERLIVAAPWTCDRTMLPKPAQQEAFDRVVSRLQTVRAGRLGVIDLGTPASLDDGDPLVVADRGVPDVSFCIAGSMGRGLSAGLSDRDGRRVRQSRKGADALELFVQ